MRPASHRAALMCGLAALAVAALASGAYHLRPLDRLTSDRLTTSGDASDVTGSIGSVRLPLSEEERGHIFDGIMQERGVPDADVPVPAPSTALPSEVPLQELPSRVTRDIPRVQGYKFVKLVDWVLLVSPDDRMVVAEMPRYRIIVD